MCVRLCEILLISFDIHRTALVFKKYLKIQNNITRNFILSLNRVTRLENWKLSQKIGGEILSALSTEKVENAALPLPGYAFYV